MRQATPSQRSLVNTQHFAGVLARPHLIHLQLQASTSGFARLPLSYARNGADRLPRIMQMSQCTVALVAFYWTRFVCHRMDMAPVELIWKTPLNFCSVTAG
jgi:hypothetical protein